MNFFEHQEVARKRSTLLVWLFILAIVLIAVCLYLPLVFFIAEMEHRELVWMQPILFAWTLGTVAFLVGTVSLFKIWSLSQGGSVIAEAMGGRLVSTESSEPLEKRLVNVVEEMSIASGIPMPLVYLLDEEESINAFAAGYTVDDAAVAVTQGALESFTREELQGVIAHEFSHIYNGDMRLNIRLLGALSGIVAIATVGRFIIRMGSGRRRSRKNNGTFYLVLMGLFIVVVGYIGAFISRIIQTAVSRQREYLADASAVQFTRNPKGIGGALQKILDNGLGGVITEADGTDIAHMCIANPMFTFTYFRMLDTHPPLEKRIERIHGVPIETLETRVAPSPRGRASSIDTSLTSGFASTVTSTAGVVTQQAVDAASVWLEQLDPVIRNAAGSGLGAFSLTALLLMDKDVEEKTVLEKSSSWFSGGEQRELMSLFHRLKEMQGDQKTLLAHLCASGLQRLSGPQLKRAQKTFHGIALEDGVISLEEACILAVVGTLVSEHSGATRTRGKVVLSSIEIVMSTAAYSGADGIGGANMAFQKGKEALPKKWQGKVSLVMQDQTQGQALVTSLQQLRQAPPAVQKPTLDACQRIIAADQIITAEEVVVMRCLAGALGVPLPLTLANEKVP